MNTPLTFDFWLVGGGALLLLSILASKFIGRFGIPSLLIFLAIGMLAGSEGLAPRLTGTGGIPFEDAGLAQNFGTVALVLILFSGGMDTRFREIKPVLLAGISLSTLGVLITSALVSLFSSYVLGFGVAEALVLGAIVSCTDAAAVFSVLRGHGVGLRGHLRPLLELESGSNDPMAAVLTIAFLGFAQGKSALGIHLVADVLIALVWGAILGLAFGWVFCALINRLRLSFEGLYPVLTFALILCAYGVTHAAGGNGFLAVYLAGLVLGNRNFIHKKSIIIFHDGIAWLAQIGMFLLLGLLVFPSRLTPVISTGLGLAAFLILVARPVAVFISLLNSQFTFREKLMISWVGMKGSVPIILATYGLTAGLVQGDLIFHLVFVVVLVSVLIQGMSLPWAARKLRVQASSDPHWPFPMDHVSVTDSDSTETSPIAHLSVPKQSRWVNRSLLELGLPENTLVILIERKNRRIVPRGGTVLEADDRLHILANPDTLLIIERMWKEALR